MIDIDVPDYNTTVSFPDGMSQDEMSAALKKQFPPKETFSSKAFQYMPGEFTPEAQPSESPLRMVAGTGQAAIETAEAGLSGLYGWGASSLSYLATLLATGDHDAATAVEKGVAEKLFVQPSSELGQVVTEKTLWPINAVFGTLQEGFEQFGESFNSRAAGHLLGIAGVLATPGMAKGTMKEIPQMFRDALNRPEKIPEVVKEKPVEAVPEPAAIATEEVKTEPPAPELKGTEGERGSIVIGKEPEPLLHEFPPEINDRWKAAVVEPTPIKDVFKERLDTFYNKLTREYEALPRNAEFAPLRFELLNLGKYKGIASDRVTRELQGLTEGLNKPLYDLFEKKVVLDDLYYAAQKGMDLPYGFTPETLAVEKILLDDLVSKQPEVALRIAKRKEMWDKLKSDYSTSMDRAGLDVEGRFKNPDYYHHQVIEYANARNIYGAGKELKTPTGRGFLKKREGSELDINRDYIQVEHDVMAQMMHDIKVADVISVVDEKYNESARFRAEYKTKLETLYKELAGEDALKVLKEDMEAGDIPPMQYQNMIKGKIMELDANILKKNNLESWKQQIPEGYDLWQPREGQVFYMADSIPAQIANELNMGALEEIGLTKEDLRQVLAVGGKRKEYVLKNEIIQTLDNLTRKTSDNVVANASKWLMRQWKEKIALIHPRGLAKYNFRNISGDGEGVFVGNPRAFKKAPESFKELYRTFFGDGKMSEDLKEFFEFGGFEGTLQSMEIKSFGDLKIFEKFYDKQKNITDIPGILWEKYWKTARLATDMREALLRFAAYKDFKEQMAKNPEGLPETFGASIPEEIMALGDIKQRAYWLQNDLLGAYDRVGVIGQELRNHIWPFWSWKEVNFRRYVNLWLNASREERLPMMIGKQLGVKAPYLAYRLGKFAIQVTGLATMLMIWNNTFHKESEESLPQEVRDSVHVVFGKDAEGKILYFDRLGMLSDFMSNFGLDSVPSSIRDVIHGKKTLKEAAKDFVKSPLNVIVSGVSPWFKIPAEVMTRRTTFPDVTKMGTIRDRKLYIAQQLKLGDEYKAIVGLPSEGYEKSFSKFFVYTSDPGQAAYFDVMDARRRFTERKGNDPEGFFITNKGNALFNYKLALRYKDPVSAEKYLDEYISLGGTGEGLMKSIQSMNPLYGLSASDRGEFVASLDSETYNKLEKAMDYYIKTLVD